MIEGLGGLQPDGTSIQYTICKHLSSTSFIFGFSTFTLLFTGFALALDKRLHGWSAFAAVLISFLFGALVVWVIMGSISSFAAPIQNY